jgi:hypothetical protein
MDWSIKNIILLISLVVIAAVGIYLNKNKEVKEDSVAKQMDKLFDTIERVDTANHPFVDSVKPKVEPKKTIVHESFWDFYYKFVLDEKFRKDRLSKDFNEVSGDYVWHALKYGDFVQQDSIRTRWLYIIEYKEYTYTYNFVNENGNWYLSSVE